MIPKLPHAARAALAADLPLWSVLPDRDAIHRDFKLRDFSDAFALMCRVALLAEAQDHHPELTNIYNRVGITLTTHDAGGLSERDLRLARAIDALG